MLTCAVEVQDLFLDRGSTFFQSEEVLIYFSKSEEDLKQVEETTKRKNKKNSSPYGAIKSKLKPRTKSN